MNITDLVREEKATIKTLCDVEKQFADRLMDLGIYEGAKVVLLNKLSFERLYLIEVDDVEICLRKEDAKMIQVIR